MKHFYLKSLLCMVMMLVGVNAWAETASWTFSSCATTANNKVVNTKLNTSKVTPSTEKGIWTAKSTANSYANTLSNYGVQLGSSNYTFNGTITLSGSNIPAAAKITCVSINAKSGGAYTVSCTVNGEALGSSTTVNSATANDYEFTGSKVGNEIVLNLSTSVKKYFAIKSVTVTYTLDPVSVVLSEGGIESVVLSSGKVGDKYVLPTTTTGTCAGKQLVGWSTVEIAETNTKPASNFYALGESITLAAPMKFYAVFAEVSGSGLADAEMSISYSDSSTPDGWTITDTKWGTSYWGLANGESYYMKSPEIADLSTIKSIKVTTKTYGTTAGDSNVLEVYSGSTTYGTQTATSTSTEYTITKSASLTGSGSVCFKSQGTTDAAGIRVTKIVIAYQEDMDTYAGYQTVVPSAFKLTIGPAGYATYYNSASKYTMPANMEGYVWFSGQLEKRFNAGDVVPAGEPLVLKAAQGNYTLTFTSAAATQQYKADSMNDLEGTDTETALTADASSYFYGLSMGKAGSANEGKVGFYWMNETGAAFTNGAHKAYLKLTKGSGVKAQYVFGENETAISQIENGNLKIENGKFMENGKIVIMKNGVKYNAAGLQIR